MVPGQTKISIARGYKNILGRDDVVGGCPNSMSNRGSERGTKSIPFQARRSRTVALLMSLRRSGKLPTVWFEFHAGSSLSSSLDGMAEGEAFLRANTGDELAEAEVCLR